MAHGHEPSKYKPGEIAWGAEHHIRPVKEYAIVILALAALMVLTIVASYIHFPGGTVVNNIIAVTIALVKATLVVLFFMHVKISTPLTRFWAVLGFVWLFWLAFILADYHTRPLDTSIAEPFISDPGSAMPKTRGGLMSEDVDPHGVNVRPRH